ncbi:MAG: site-2 protease family protein, partial [Ignavibacteriales bacterium]|nr:site-2 protease family protein [Ignavibacteriales bacterium]
QYPRRSSLMALAGPMANFLLVFIAAGLIHLGIALGWFYPPDSINFSTIVISNNSGVFSVVAKFVSIMFSLNLILFFFNLLPVPPLDGSSVISLFLPLKKARKYLQFIKNPAFAIFGIFIAWKLFDYIYISIFLFAINLLYPWLQYV